MERKRERGRGGRVQVVLVVRGRGQKTQRRDNREEEGGRAAVQGC
jgi:hypothetical protein